MGNPESFEQFCRRQLKNISLPSYARVLRQKEKQQVQVALICLRSLQLVNDTFREIYSRITDPAVLAKLDNVYDIRNEEGRAREYAILLYTTGCQWPTDAQRTVGSIMAVTYERLEGRLHQCGHPILRKGPLVYAIQRPTWAQPRPWEEIQRQFDAWMKRMLLIEAEKIPR